MQTYLHGPTDYAKTLKLRFCVGDLDLPERSSSRDEEDEDAQLGPCSKGIDSTTHIVERCEMYREEGDVLDMMKTDECDMEKFGTLL